MITSCCLPFVFANCPHDLVDNDVEEDAWDVIRFSGRAADGSKRTIKLWSLNHILQALNDPAPHLINIASLRNVPSCPRFHPRLGWTALVHQPQRAAGGLSILHDRDIFLLADPSTTTKSLRYAVLGVTCDLLLTSVLLFDTSSHRFLDPPRSRFLVKWLGQDSLLNPDTLDEDEAIKSIYKSETYYPTLHKNLENEMRRLLCLGAGVSQKSDSEADDETSIQISGTLLLLGEHNDIQGPYNRFLFAAPPTFIQSNDNTLLEYSMGTGALLASRISQTIICN